LAPKKDGAEVLDPTRSYTDSLLVIARNAVLLMVVHGYKRLK
jgi:hypothetical protein